MALNDDTREPSDKSQGDNMSRHQHLHRDIMNQFSVKEGLLFTMKHATERPPNSFKILFRMIQRQPQPLP
jgi:hypothetical protein